MNNILSISKISLTEEKEFDPNRIIKYRIDPNEIIPPPPAVWVQNTEDGEIVLGTLGNFSVIIGKAKSRKSFLVTFISAILNRNFEQFSGRLPNDQSKILYFDTEQGKYHCQKALKRVFQLCDVDSLSNLEMYFLRSVETHERMQIIRHLIENTPNLGFVIIDGVRDLVSSINEEKDAIEISANLLKWTEEKNIHILNVLHQNKGNEHARGHLGTELINKAETVFSVTKSSENENISIVKAEFCRNKEPKPFAFEIIDGLPVLVEDFEIKTTASKKISVTDIEDHLKFQLFTKAFSKCKEYGYGELVRVIKINFHELFNKDIGENKTKDIITYAKSKSWILQEGLKKPYSLGSYNNS